MFTLSRARKTYQEENGVERVDSLDGQNRLWIREYFVDGKSNGERTVYYSSIGKCHIKEFYKDGKREGTRTTWHENGQLGVQEYFVEGKADGKVQSWYDNGSEMREQFYRSGRPEGTDKIWFMNGTLMSISRFQDGLRISRRKWHRNGIIECIAYFKDGKINGRHRIWYNNGQYCALKTWNMDRREGEQKFWNEDGTVVHHEYYYQEKIFPDFKAGSVVFRTLKIRLYTRMMCKRWIKCKIFLISDLTSIIMNMISI